MPRQSNKPQFWLVEEVVMIEAIPSRDDGFPDREERTVIASKKKRLDSDEIAAHVTKVTRA